MRSRKTVARSGGVVIDEVEVLGHPEEDKVCFMLVRGVSR